MRKSVAAWIAAHLFVAFAVPAVQAAPTQVNVRVEGESRTLFEGPVLTDVHRVKASSDEQWRRCNGINVNTPWNVNPAPVPTSASSDAMRIVGESFDGLWYGQYEDYFVKRWGPDAQDPVENEYWGLLVNHVFANVGGCQYQLDAGDEVLWAYDAFDGRTRLALYPADYTGDATPLTAVATPGQPFEVEVDGWSAYSEGVPPASPQRSGSSPFQGAEVAPVESGEKGFARVETESAATVVTDADGKASIVFDEPGWHRIKATVVDSQGEEAVIRSNRLDVCVPQPPAGDCGAPPAEDQPRTPPPPVAGEAEAEGPGEGGPPGGGEGAGAGGPIPLAAAPATVDARQVRLQLLGLDRSRVGRGLVKVSWQVLDAGAGIERWTISSKKLGRSGARYVTRASGRDRSAATLRLPPGAAYRLRLTVTDVLGRGTSASIGRVRVPA